MSRRPVVITLRIQSQGRLAALQGDKTLAQLAEQFELHANLIVE